MKYECVGFNHLNGTAALVNAVAIVELDRSEISEEQNVRCNAAHLKCFRLARVFDCGALASDAKGVKF